MSFTPYDHEDEERRDSERFADPSVYDEGPDPSEYEDPDPDSDPDLEKILVYGEPWQHDFKKIVVHRKPGIINPNGPLKGLLGLLVAILLGLMFWIMFGAAIIGWLT